MDQQGNPDPPKVDDMAFMRGLIAFATIVLWLALVALAIASAWYADWQKTFLEAATKVLIPLFNATIAASLAYIFGKPITIALIRRLTKS